MKTILISLFCLILGGDYAYSYSFKQVLEIIKDHEAVESINNNAKSLMEMGNSQNSWGDPIFKLAAKNFPRDSFKDDESPMTGIEFSLTQKIALTTKYGNLGGAYREMGKAKNLEAENKKEELVKFLWMVLINNRKLEEEIKILKENNSWIKKMLKVSKRLYANGKISQQALFDIQIRKSEIEADLSNRGFELKQEEDRLGYLLKFKDKFDYQTIPWKVLREKSKTSKIRDLKELALKSNVKAKSHMLTASKLDYVPDLTFSIGYTKRSDIDKNGDFISAAVSFPIPTSSKKYANHSQAAFGRVEALKKMADYKRLKTSRSSRLRHESLKIKTELEIVNGKTIKFAENSRKITSKSYSLGQASYVELLQSELKLQKLLIKRSSLRAMLSHSQVAYKYLIGEKLYE